MTSLVTSLVTLLVTSLVTLLVTSLVTSLMARPCRKKYIDFEEKDPEERRGKTPPHNLRMYVDILCPHCKNVFSEIPSELVLSNKAGECLKHLRVCPEFKGAVAPAPEKKEKGREPTNADLLAQLKQMREENRGMTRRIAHGLGLGDPLPDDERLLVDKVNANKQTELSQARQQIEQANQRVLKMRQQLEEQSRKRKRDAEKSALFDCLLGINNLGGDWAKKKLRALLHSDKNPTQSEELSKFQDTLRNALNL